jgi:S-DNA-T family DNA segregation ATPase FtsK/SpoIIIE
VQRVAALLEPHVRGRAGAPVPAMPSRLDQSVLPAPTGSHHVLAVDADAVAPLVVDLLAGPVLLAGRSRSGRTSALAGLAALAARGDTPPSIVHEPDPVAADAALAAWETGAGAPAEGSSPWCLMLVDDAHLWEDQARIDAAGREARDRLLTRVQRLAGRVALVVAADTAYAKQRTLPEGLVDLARRARRGFLLQPEWADGDVAGVTVPTRTSEPLTGPGRGVWCDGGEVWPAQLLAGERSEQ